MTDSDVETGSAAYIGICRLRMDQELATATRGRVQLVIYNYLRSCALPITHTNSGEINSPHTFDMTRTA
jgi:hypothetical protein